MLLERTGVDTSLSWLTSRMKSLEEDGLIKREINGKRTLSIAIKDKGRRYLSELQSGEAFEAAGVRRSQPAKAARPTRPEIRAAKEAAASNGKSNGHTDGQVATRPDPLSSPLSTLGTDVDAQLIVRLQFGGTTFEADWDAEKFKVMGLRLVNGQPELELGWSDDDQFLQTVAASGV